MKKLRRISAYLICMILTLAIVQIPVFAQENIVEGKQKIYVEGKDWGPAITKTIIEFNEVINADSVSKEDFKVIEEKNASSSERKVLDAYTSNDQGYKTAENAYYVTIEMYVSPKEGSSFVYKSFNEWCESYKLNITLNDGQNLMSGDTQITALNIDSKIDIDGDGRICPQLDGFDMRSFTASDGKTLSYGAWTPEEDNQKNPLIIWLHGAGEGGTDPSISILGNRVTGLIGESTQTSMGGAYVLVPQTPTAWMDGYDYLQAGGNSIYSLALMELIENYVNSHTDIDSNRIYIGGCSNGGYMTLEMLTLYPDYFAAAYSICTGYSSVTMSDENLEKIKDIPIWFVYALNDPYSIADQFSQPLINRLKALGAKNIHVSEFEDVHDTSESYWGDPENPNILVDYESGVPYQYNGHWSWVYAFNNECYDENDNSLELFSWLSKQTKAASIVQEEPEQTTEIKKEDVSIQSVKTGDNSLYSTYAFIMMLAMGGLIILKEKYA